MINMNTLRILGLDDDNHEVCFCTETGEHFHNSMELIKFLGQPHNFAISLRTFAIVEDWFGELNSFPEDQVDRMFYFLEGYSHIPENMSLERVFELFWEAAGEI